MSGAQGNPDVKVRVDGNRVVTTLASGWDMQMVFTSSAKATAFAKRTAKHNGFTLIPPGGAG